MKLEKARARSTTGVFAMEGSVDFITLKSTGIHWCLIRDFMYLFNWGYYRIWITLSTHMQKWKKQTKKPVLTPCKWARVEANRSVRKQLQRSREERMMMWTTVVVVKMERSCQIFGSLTYVFRPDWSFLLVSSERPASSCLSICHK